MFEAAENCKTSTHVRQLTTSIQHWSLKQFDFYKFSEVGATTNIKDFNHCVILIDHDAFEAARHKVAKALRTLTKI